jgi:hypothetical protein
VRYELHREQHDSGVETVRGTIRPPCFVGESGLVLELEDGRTLPFFFGDGYGTVIGAAIRPATRAASAGE